MREPDNKIRKGSLSGGLPKKKRPDIDIEKLLDRKMREGIGDLRNELKRQIPQDATNYYATGGGSVRKATTTEAATSSNHITCNLYDSEGNEATEGDDFNVEVYCIIIGNNNLDECSPRLENDTDLFVTKYNGAWWCISAIFEETATPGVVYRAKVASTSTTTVDAEVYDETGSIPAGASSVTVHLSFVGSGGLDTAIPQLNVDDIIFITYLVDTWYYIGTLQTYDNTELHLESEELSTKLAECPLP